MLVNNIDTKLKQFTVANLATMKGKLEFSKVTKFNLPSTIAINGNNTGLTEFFTERDFTDHKKHQKHPKWKQKK